EISGENGTDMTICLMCNDYDCDRHDPELAVHLQPWKRLLVDAEVNRKLEELFDFLLHKYTSQWLDDVCFNKEEILLKLRELIRLVTAALILRVKKRIQPSSVMLNKLPKFLMHHLEMYVHGKRNAKSASFLEESVLRQYGSLLHPAMHSAD